jgi:sugar phosphate isomerase/epimerase
MERRKFIQSASMAAVGMLAAPSLLEAAMKKKKKALGLQLYSLRDIMPQDPKGVLKKVAGFGYNEVETYGYSAGKLFGLAAKEFGDYCKSLGIKVTSGHYGIDVMRLDWQRAIDDANAIGQKYMIIPYLGGAERTSMDDYKKRCEEFNKAGEICKKNGIRFGYHNHAFEFENMNGQIPYDVMLAELDPKYVGMEMDIFWVVNAGFDPLQYFAKYPGRFEQWHVKDMDKGDKNRNADVGTGSIDFKALFAKAKLSGMTNFYVEQETYPGTPIDSIEKSATYVKTII